MENKAVVILFILLFPSLGFAGKVLDLGQLEIEGEVRRPRIDILDSADSVKKMLKSMQIRELKNFETEMLKPLPLPKKKEMKNGRRNKK